MFASRKRKGRGHSGKPSDGYIKRKERVCLKMWRGVESKACEMVSGGKVV